MNIPSSPEMPEDIAHLALQAITGVERGDAEITEARFVMLPRAGHDAGGCPIGVCDIGG
jgi:hypothetical protein